MGQIRTCLLAQVNFDLAIALVRTLPEISDSSARTFTKPQANLHSWVGPNRHCIAAASFRTGSGPEPVVAFDPLTIPTISVKACTRFQA